MSMMGDELPATKGHLRALWYALLETRMRSQGMPQMEAKAAAGGLVPFTLPEAPYQADPMLNQADSAVMTHQMSKPILDRDS